MAAEGNKEDLPTNDAEEIKFSDLGAPRLSYRDSVFNKLRQERHENDEVRVIRATEENEGSKGDPRPETHKLCSLCCLLFRIVIVKAVVRAGAYL